MKFGIVGTLLSYAVQILLMYSVLKGGLLTKPQIVDGETIQVPIKFEMYEVLCICALLCSTDTIAAISMISYKE